MNKLDSKFYNEDGKAFAEIFTDELGLYSVQCVNPEDVEFSDKDNVYGLTTFSDTVCELGFKLPSMKGVK